jgi:hypothetical protein
MRCTWLWHTSEFIYIYYIYIFPSKSIIVCANLGALCWASLTRYWMDRPGILFNLLFNEIQTYTSLEMADD